MRSLLERGLFFGASARDKRSLLERVRRARTTLLRATLVAALTLVAAALPAAADETDGAGVFELPARALAGAQPFESHRGQAGVIVLFQPDCPWCQLQLRAAEALAQSRTDLAVIALGLRGRPQALMSELRSARAHPPAYRASPLLLERLGDPEGTPRVYVVDAAGRVVAAARGYQDQAALAALAGGL